LDEGLQKVDPHFAIRTEAIFMERPAYNGHEYRWGDRRGEIMDFFLFANDEPFPPVIASGSQLTLFVRYRFHAQDEGRCYFVWNEH
jgi:lipopolysaccharide transport system ATP-binding protein